MKMKILVVIAVTFSSYLQAQDSTKSLSEVVITATKSSIKQSQTGKVVTIIDKATIEKSMGKDLSQLLTEQSGIVVNGATSNTGKDKALYMLGAKNDYTVILINGVSIVDASGVTGAFDPRLIPIDQIERIEIVKGAQSTLYGSNAVAGVINIITKVGGNKEASVYGTVSAGSYLTKNINIGVRGTAENASYDVGYIHKETNGISEAKDTMGNKNFDKDGVNQNGIYLNVDAVIAKGFHFKPFFRYTYLTGGYDAGAFTDAANNYTSSALSTGSIFQYAANKLGITAQYQHDETVRLYQSTWGNYFYEGRTQSAEIFANYKVATHVKILGGLDYKYLKSLDTNATPKNPSVNIFSPYISLFINNIAGFNFELGSRYTKHSKYGDNFTYSFNPSYLIKNKIKLFVNIASAYRVPALQELYGQWGGNVNLHPETSQTIEGGLQSSFNKFDIRANYFKRKINNVITYLSPGKYINLNKQNDHGVELESTLKINKKLRLKIFYNFVTGEVTTNNGIKDTTYFNLLKRPKNSAGATLSYQINKRLFISTNMYNYGKCVDSYYNNLTYTNSLVTLNSYYLLNAYAEYSVFPKKLKLFVDIKNILNKNYYEVYGYSTQKLNVLFGIHCSL